MNSLDVINIFDLMLDKTRTIKVHFKLAVSLDRIIIDKNSHWWHNITVRDWW